MDDMKNEIVNAAKDPMSYDIWTYVWVSLLSLWGGIAGYIRKVKSGVVARFNISELIGDVVISGFVGLLTFFICEDYGLSKMQSAVMIAISGHMGCRALFIFDSAIESSLDNALKRWLGKTDK